MFQFCAQRLLISPCHVTLNLGRWGQTCTHSNQEPMTDQNKHTTRVQYSRLMSFIGVTDRSMGEGLPQDHKWLERQRHHESSPCHKSCKLEALCTTCRQLNRLENVCFRQLNLSESASQQSSQLIYLEKRGPSLSGGFQGVPEPFELNGCPFRTSCVPGEEVLLDHRKLTHSLSLSLSSGEMVLDLEVEKRLCLSMLTTTQSKWRMLTFAVRMPRVTDWQLCLTSGNLNSSPHAWVTNTSPFEPFPQPLILVLFWKQNKTKQNRAHCLALARGSLNSRLGLKAHTTTSWHVIPRLLTHWCLAFYGLAQSNIYLRK